MGLSSKTFSWYIGQRRTLGARLRKLIRIFLSNPKIAAGAAISLIALFGLFMGYSEWRSRHEAKAADLLLKAVSVLPAGSKSAEDVAKQDEGLRLLGDVARQYPRTPAGAEAALRLGNHFYALGNYNEVRMIYQRYLEKNPKGRVAFAAGMGIGDSYLAEGNYEKAGESYSRLIEQFPKDSLLPEAYMNLARTYKSMKKEQDAARLYEKVMEGYPNTGWAQNAQSQLRMLIHR